MQGRLDEGLVGLARGTFLCLRSLPDVPRELERRRRRAGPNGDPPIHVLVREAPRALGDVRPPRACEDAGLRGEERAIAVASRMGHRLRSRREGDGGAPGQGLASLLAEPQQSGLGRRTEAAERARLRAAQGFAVREPPRFPRAGRRPRPSGRHLSPQQRHLGREQELAPSCDWTALPTALLGAAARTWCWMHSC